MPAAAHVVSQFAPSAALNQQKPPTIAPQGMVVVVVVEEGVVDVVVVVGPAGTHEMSTSAVEGPLAKTSLEFEQVGRPFACRLATPPTVLHVGRCGVSEHESPFVLVTIQVSPDRSEMFPLGAATVTLQLGVPNIWLPPGQFRSVALTNAVMP